MSVTSDTCQGYLVSENARVQGYSKCFVSLCREMIASSLIVKLMIASSLIIKLCSNKKLRDQNLDQSKLIIIKLA